MNTDKCANINEYKLSSMNNIKLQNFNNIVSNDIFSSELLLLNSNNEKLINYQLLNSFQQIPQNAQNFETNFDTSNSSAINLPSQQSIQSINESINNNLIEGFSTKDDSNLPTITDIKKENINNSKIDYGENKSPYLKNSNIPYASNSNEINQNLNYISNIDNLYLYNNNNTNMEPLNNCPLGRIIESVPSNSLLTNKVSYNPSKYISLDNRNYNNLSSISSSNINNSQSISPMYINNSSKTTFNTLTNTNEILTIPPSINAINKETKFIYKRRKRQSLDKTNGNTIQKKVKKKLKINQDLVHEKPGGLVSVNVIKNKPPYLLNESNPIYSTGFRGRKLKGKFTKGYNKNDYIYRKINSIDYQIPEQKLNLNNINTTTVTSPINNIKKETEELNSSYFQLQLNNQLSDSNFFTSFTNQNLEVINDLAAISTKPSINQINPFFSLNDPNTLAKPISNQTYVINRNDVKDGEVLSSLNSINKQVMLDTLVPTTLISSSSSSPLSPKDYSIVSSLNSINNYSLNNVITTTDSTLSIINSKNTEPINYNIYPYA